MPYELIDHQADVGLEASGETIEQALVDGVRGMLSLMVERESVRPSDRVAIEASGGDPGSLYVDLLNAVLAAKDIHGMFFHDIILVTCDEHDGAWRLTAELSGEPIDLNHHDVDTEVKAATYGGLRVRHDQGAWRLRCVLDL